MMDPFEALLESKMRKLFSELLPDIFELYRRTKGKPEYVQHAEDMAYLIRSAVSIGQTIFDRGGANALYEFIDQMEDEHGTDIATWLHRRWACVVFQPVAAF